MVSTYDIISAIISVSISLAAFIYSAIKLSKKDTSRYFIFLNLATGCYAIQEICSNIYYLCGNIEYNGFVASMLGTAGCFLFIFTACFAVLEKQIKKDDVTKKAGRIALLAPTVVLIFTAVMIALSIGTDYTGAAIVISILILPCFPASYYSFKHFILREHNESCKKTTISNITVILFILTNLLFLVAYFFMPLNVINTVSIAIGVEAALLSLSCVKEDEQWKI